MTHVRRLAPLAVILAVGCTTVGPAMSEHPGDCDTQPEGPSSGVSLSSTNPPTVTLLLGAGLAVRAPRFSGSITVSPRDQHVLLREDHGRDPAVAIFGADRLGTVRFDASGARATVRVVCHLP